ncbi:MAG: shikimate kinase [Verrucomicrobiota bacterium]
MSDTRNIRNLALVGFMGVGKTTIGHLLAAQLDFRFVDTDQLIEAQAGHTIAEIFAKSGEATFRELERQVVQALKTYSNTVIATGGGLPCLGDNLAELKTHALTVCLWASPESVYERVRHQAHRPLLHTPDPLGKIRELLALREPYYRQADILVSTDTRSPRDLVSLLAYEFRSVVQKS